MEQNSSDLSVIVGKDFLCRAEWF